MFSTWATTMAALASSTFPASCAVSSTTRAAKSAASGPPTRKAIAPIYPSLGAPIRTEGSSTSTMCTAASGLLSSASTNPTPPPPTLPTEAPLQTRVGPRSLCLNDLDWLIQLERQHRLRRHFDRAALRRDLTDRAGSSAGSRADRRTFSAARNRTHNGAEGRSSAGKHCSPLVRAKSLLAALLQISRANKILLASNRN